MGAHDGERRGIMGTFGVRALKKVGRRIESFGSNRTRLPSGWDEYLTWLNFAVSGMLNRHNVDAMFYALKNLPPNTSILEIGSFCGLSTCVLIYLKTKAGISAPLFTCDKWAFEGQRLGEPLGGIPLITHDAYRDFVRKSFIENTKTFCSFDLPYTIENDSDEFFSLWSKSQATEDVFGRTVTIGGSIGFAYVDGNHTYAYAKRDFENIDRNLVRGGFILFDDSRDGTDFGVGDLMKEIRRGAEYVVVSKNPNYMFRKN